MDRTRTPRSLLIAFGLSIAAALPAVASYSVPSWDGIPPVEETLLRPRDTATPSAVPDLGLGSLPILRWESRVAPEVLPARDPRLEGLPQRVRTSPGTELGARGVESWIRAHREEISARPEAAAATAAKR